MFHKQEARVILTDLHKTAGLSEYFSGREAGLTKKLLLALFTQEEKINAALLVCASPYLLLEESTVKFFFTVVTAFSSPILARSRDFAMFQNRFPGCAGGEAFLAELKGYAETLGPGEELKLLGLDAGILVDKIRESSPSLDEYRAFQDINALIRSLLDGAPVFASPKRGKIVLTAVEGRPGARLLAHQLSLALCRLFQELRELPGLAPREEVLPETAAGKAALERLLA